MKNGGDMVEEMIIKIQQVFARSMLTFVAFVGCVFFATVLAQMAYTPPGMYRAVVHSPDANALEISRQAETGVYAYESRR